MFWRCLGAVLGGAVLAAAFEPVGWAVLLPLGTALLFLTTHGLAPRRAWPVSLLFGTTFIYTVMYWMRDSVGVDAWIAMCAVLSAYFIPLGIGLAWSYRTRWWPLLGAVWWVGLESVRSVWPFSGMPFGRLSYATAGSVWEEALPWLGMTGVSLLVALTGAVLAWAVLEVRRQPARVAAGVAALGLLTGLPHVVEWDFERDGDLDVAVVQGNVPGDGTDVVGNHRDITRNHVRLTRQLAQEVEEGQRARPDLVVWPENSTAVDPFTDSETNAGIQIASEEIGVPVLVGAMVDAESEDHVLNQGIVWTPGRGGGDRYTKRHPVPYGEYIPFRDTIIPSDYGQLRSITRDMVRGVRVSPLDVEGTKVADAICFDVAYDEGIAAQLQRGGRLLTVQTSNAMFIHTAQVDQQFEISRLRAVESRRWVVVAALNGVSGIISPDGEVVATEPRRTEAVLQHTVGLSSRLTPASLAGVWTGRVLVAVVTLHALLVVVPYRRRSRRTRRDLEASARETVHT